MKQPPENKEISAEWQRPSYLPNIPIHVTPCEICRKKPKIPGVRVSVCTYDPVIIERIAAHVANGMSLTGACGMPDVGISSRTLQRWADRHEELKPIIEALGTATVTFIEKLIVDSLKGERQGSLDGNLAHRTMVNRVAVHDAFLHVHKQPVVNSPANVTVVVGVKRGIDDPADTMAVQVAVDQPQQAIEHDNDED